MYFCDLYGSQNKQRLFPYTLLDQTTGFHDLHALCLMCVKNWIFTFIFVFKGCVMAQAVRRRPLTAEAQVRSQVIPCKIGGGQGGTPTGFSPRTFSLSIIVQPMLRICLHLLHYWYHNTRTLTVTYYIAVSFKEILVSAPWIWWYNNAETCRSHAQVSTHRLENSALAGVT
jgi:hypothetical protein